MEPVKQTENEAITRNKIILKVLHNLNVPATGMSIYNTLRYTEHVLEVSDQISIPDPEDLESELGPHLNRTDKVRVEITKQKGTHQIQVVVPKDYFVNFDLHEMTDTFDLAISGFKLPVFLGLDKYYDNNIQDLVELDHIIMCGQRNPSQSMFSHVLISSCKKYFDPSYVQFLILDAKRMEFVTHKDSPYLYSPILQADCDIDTKGIFHALAKLAKEKQQRIDNLDSRTPKYLVVIINGFHSLASANFKKFNELIGELVKDSAKSGIHIIMSDESPLITYYKASLVIKFPTKIVFKTPSAYESSNFCGKNWGVYLQDRGDMWLFTEKELPVRLQAPSIYKP